MPAPFPRTSSATRPHGGAAALGAVVLAALAQAPAAGGDADGRTYLDVPRVTATDPAYFRGLLAAASGEVVRIALFGDSQETAPAGFGRQYVAHLNARFAKVFGPATESVVYSNIDQVDPPQWLAATQASRALAPSSSNSAGSVTRSS